MGQFLLDLVKRFATFIGGLIGDAVANSLSFLRYSFERLGDYLASLFDTLVSALSNLFAPLLELLDGLGYFISQAFDVVVLALKIALKLFTVPFSLVGSFFGVVFDFLTWNGSASFSYESGINSGFTWFFNILSTIGGDVFAGVLCVLIWLLFVFSILRVARGAS